ncbi:hypothetical protein NJB14197_50480 [Mycobacterium montefiorense]|uniref:Uncharacterized protein n=1 Tax=Mycobacterium montefiorense TaxID=154654 RepID=A0AA37UW00_9MYCO|nr:hypothetical protein MmonteBS_19660 [Mycobacterium montefiorense]GKU37096.1 hypothetical protein NJB14191_44420 [Mycobacterium montefiorense]GKU40102.1 hypothetical protein NJB14192_20890 [Mycobacterium montefiorense]GKU46520.1 hypothetical protein NJB14194_31380 [Mycobacterium montefiorense]GKU50414.1 hypothetical protein NJB14195_16600 [Mycobacterium montefiorense]
MFVLERELNRIADIAVEVVNVTALHVRRIVAALCTALGRTKREVSDLAWDYSELAASLRRSARAGSTTTGDRDQTAESQEIADVISIELRRRQAN